MRLLCINRHGDSNMNCDMTIVVEGPDSRGWRRLRCSHRGCTKQTDWTPHNAERIHFQCKAWPHVWEIGDWVALVLAAFNITPRGWGLFKRALRLRSFLGNCNTRRMGLNRFGQWLYKKLVEKGN